MRRRSRPLPDPIAADAALLTGREVQAMLQIGRTKLWELVRAGAFPAYRIGEGRNSSLRYRRADLLRWLECQRVGGAELPLARTAPADRSR